MKGYVMSMELQNCIKGQSFTLKEHYLLSFSLGRH